MCPKIRFFAIFLSLIAGISPAFAGLIVLKNGKKIPCKGPYEVDGAFLVYQDLKGQQFRIPTKIVNLDASERDFEPGKKKEEVGETLFKAEPLIKEREDVDLYEAAKKSNRDPVSEGGQDMVIDEAKMRQQYYKRDRGSTSLVDHWAIDRFYYAVKHNDVNDVAFLLGEGVPPDGPIYKQQGKLPPLLIAARKGYKTIVKMLLAADVRLEVADDEGNTPLNLAAREMTQTHTSISMMLLAKGAKANTTNRDLETPLYFALHSNNSRLLYALTRNGAPIDEPDHTGIYPLMRAIKHLDVKASKILLDAGASIKISDSKGNTPFVEALRLDSIPIMELLIKAGATENYKADQSRELVNLALSGNSANSAAYLMEKLNVKNIPNKNEHLSRAVSSNRLEMALFLIEKGAPASGTGISGEPLLIEAARAGHLNMVKLLIDRGADPYVKSKKGVTAYTEAGGTQRDDIRTFLRQVYQSKTSEKK
ncbi:Ankyrin repeat domain-containing protein [Sulfidibacter corallicola]|uniref:Ankyrin repeat domain-containing protein n=1 Tax=Sulfidibacter corallicola TaxID=2818388 RepID=A0A8A4TT37_SULCO|nr:ankyrin repeat domain-containing protein [Sulfidibacter corallicola]QTD53119.1 ankyrin repeat domain-containing protein [Sulfidibacter corallicola]